MRITVLKNSLAIPLLASAAFIPLAVAKLFHVKLSGNLVITHSLPFVILAATLVFPARFYDKTYVFGIIGAGIAGLVAQLLLYGWLWYNLAHDKGGGVNILWSMTAYYLPFWIIPVMAFGFKAGRGGAVAAGRRPES